MGKPIALLEAPKTQLPYGLAFHCRRCRVVIPLDAPSFETPGDCETVAKHRLAWFNPKASARHQHTMATAAWEMIHWHRIHRDPHPAAVAYKQQFNRRPEEHWASSAVAKALCQKP